MNRMIMATVFAFATFSSLASLAEEKAPWETLGLEKATLDGRTFYFEKALEAKIQVFKEQLVDYLAVPGIDYNGSFMGGKMDDMGIFLAHIEGIKMNIFFGHDDSSSSSFHLADTIS